MFNYRLVFQFLGLLLLIEGIFIWLCIPVSLLSHEHELVPLGVSGLISIICGGSIWLSTLKAPKTMSARDGF